MPKHLTESLVPFVIYKGNYFFGKINQLHKFLRDFGFCLTTGDMEFTFDQTIFFFYFLQSLVILVPTSLCVFVL